MCDFSERHCSHFSGGQVRVRHLFPPGCREDRTQIALGQLARFLELILCVFQDNDFSVRSLNVTFNPLEYPLRR